jgi:transposase-like protein
MQNKRRWLPRWQRIELVQLCLEQGLTRREAAAWRRVSVSTVQFWVERYRQADEADRASGVWRMNDPQPLTGSLCSRASKRMTVSARPGHARAGARG